MRDNQPVCHLCGQFNCVRKHGFARSGFQRYYCTSCKRTFQINYIYQGNEANILRQIKILLAEGKSRMEIGQILCTSLAVVDRHIYLLNLEEETVV